ncbi:MAG: YfiR family protein [Verrucomicrobia bacterium]|nr:YfiR family protein [Verrucomicrobiota bacterium]
MALLNRFETDAHPSRRGAWWSVAALFVGLVLTAAGAPAAAPPSAEYQVKAVFLYNFAQFAEWPATMFPDAQSPIVIGILGDDPFGRYLDDLVQGEKLGNRSIIIRRYQDVGSIGECHVLFISRSESSRLDGIVAVLKRRSILTISDAETFTRRGGMVRFAMDSGKIRLRINLEAAKACGLTISSKIVRPSTIVSAEND